MIQVGFLKQFSKKTENDRIPGTIKLTVFRIIGKSKSKCGFSRVAGSGSKFMMILLAMFDSSVLDVGAKFTS